MELQRKEYPALLDSLSPAQAVNVLNDRMRHVGQLNNHIADWLQERRRIEELYVQGLRKLAHKHFPDEPSDLGIFSTPWQKIVSATEAIADSHHQLAQKIEADVERPLRDFSSNNREMQAMGNISGNLSAMAKEIDTAKKKSDKLRDKGVKAQASKVASAVADVENASLQWQSQAPYVFEKLQAVDESRLNHLRDVLTQFQTHEVDQVERNRVTAEETLNVLLNIETSDEIKTFVLRLQNGEAPPTSSSGRKPSSVSTPSRNLAPPSQTPPVPDDRSQKSGSVHEVKHGGLHSLKRFGTVLGRRRQSTHPYGRPASPERKSSTNLGGAFSGFGKNKHKDREVPSSSSARPASPVRMTTSRASDVSTSPKNTQMLHSEKTNGTAVPESTEETRPGSSSINGTARETIPEMNEPLSPPSATNPTQEPEKDAEGFSVRPSASDAITEAEREAALMPNESSHTPHFKLDIRNAPIQEEEGDADAALASIATAPPKRASTLRGRRDVRNTIFVPNPSTPELTALGSIGEVAPTSAPAGSGGDSETFPAPTLPTQPISPPFKVPHRTHLSDDHPASDTQSVMSGRSLSSAASTSVKHPDLHEPGLNASLVETVSAWFEHGKVTKAMVIGQVALAYNPEDISAGPFGSESIRLDNFPVLEKVAPNPAFIEQLPETPGNYTVDLSRILKTSVAFHYQLHLDSENVDSFAPVILSPSWKAEATQTSAILHCSLNPKFDLGNASSVTLRNLILIVRLEPGVKTTSCQSKPPGTFSRDKGLIYWRMGDVTFSRDQPNRDVRVRFFTDGEAKPGNTEARWEIRGSDCLSMGSGLAVSQSASAETKTGGEDDPFADAEETVRPATPVAQWKPVATVKKIASGTYLGV
ncbi:hypothetical protein M011DRAFT_403058 [Sporormia fimetaria CBS 119925]|uniref:MHD domain-containing protein n=1 Tax=Sporormia fimetaria CBS 119925 TaxID=1340428 RepID=A0A6A6V927_9PLEO|nr:hypothetical protein M011DRAFT_403058 [Sporormia fimetaria CBS 119925]